MKCVFARRQSTFGTYSTRQHSYFGPGSNAYNVTQGVSRMVQHQLQYKNGHILIVVQESSLELFYTLGCISRAVGVTRYLGGKITFPPARI